MLSRMAREDLEQLEAEGVEVKPTDAVELNDLALQIERSTSFLPLCQSRRAARHRNSDRVFMQPTLAHERWFCDVVRLVDEESPDAQWSILGLRVLQATTPAESLPDPQSLDAVRKAVQQALEDVGGVTIEELDAMFRWLQHGTHFEAKPTVAAVDREEDLQSNWATGIIWNGALLGLGSLQEVQNLTLGQYSSALALARLRIDHKKPTPSDRALADYCRLVEKLRHQKEHGKS